MLSPNNAAGFGNRLPREQIQCEVYYAATLSVPGSKEESPYAQGALVALAPWLADLPQAPDEFRPLHYAPEHIMPGDETGIDRANYLRQLRQLRTDPMLRATITNAASALRRYRTTFQPAVEALRTKLDDENTELEPLGIGQSSEVYPLAVEGRRYVLHDFHDSPADAYGLVFGDEIAEAYYGDTSTYLQVLAATKALDLAHAHDLPRVAQLAAFDPASHACISPYVPGKAVTDITLADIERIEPAHVYGYIGTLERMQTRDLAVDPNTNNLRWSAKGGVKVLDPARLPMSNRRAGLAVQALVRGIIGVPESHYESRFVGSPAKIAASPRLLKLLQRLTMHHFGVELPVTVDALNDAYQESFNLSPGTAL